MKKKIEIIKNMIKIVYRSNPSTFWYATCVCIITYLTVPISSQLYYKVLALVEKHSSIVDFPILKCVLLLIGIVMIAGIERVTGYSNILLFEKMQVKVGVNLLKRVYIRTEKVAHSFFDVPENASKIERIALYAQDSILTQNTVHLLEVIARIISITIYIPVLAKVGWEYFFVIIIISLIGNSLNFNEGYQRWEFNKSLEKGKRRLSEIKGYFGSKDVVMETKMNQCTDFIKNEWLESEKKVQGKVLEFEKEIQRQKLKCGMLQVLLDILPLVLVSIMMMNGKLGFSVAYLIWQTQMQMDGLVSGAISEWRSTYFSLGYIDEMFDYITSGNEIEMKDINTSSQLSFDLNNVSFGYQEGEKVLCDISLNVKDGEKVALVGVNGSGKSSLVKLMTGLYSPTEGKIKYYDQEMKDIYLKYMRKTMGAVWQEYTNFELTVRESIGFGDLTMLTDDNEVENVIRSINLEHELSLDTVLGRSFDEDGVILSGGQWQRLAIGRAIFGKKSCIFMDEPTASLDPIAEVEIFNEVKRLFQNKTAVFVSHRIGFARLADRIIVMNHGSIVEEGTHDELVLKKGLYSRLYQSQAQWYI